MDMGIRPDMFVQGCAPRRLTSGSRRGNARVFSRYWSASASCHRCSSTSRWCGVGGRWGQPPRETRHRRSVGSRRFGLVRTRTGALVAPAHLGHEAWPLWALLTACAAGGQILEQRTACGKYTSAPLLAMLLALGLAVVGFLPTACVEFDVVWKYLLPIGATLFLLEADLSSVLSSGTAVLVAYAVGVAGTIVGTLVAWMLVGAQLGTEGWKVAAALCATYIGGSVNFAAVAAMVQLESGPLMACTMAADNIVMAVYLAAISLIPVTPARPSDTAKALPETDVPGSRPVDTESLICSLAVAVSVVALGSMLGVVTNTGAGMLMFATLLASAVGMASNAFVVRGRYWFRGAKELGVSLLLIFFATIGAGAGDLSALLSNLWILAFICIQLSVHLAVVLAVGLAVKLPMEALLTASNANVGGPATAAAMAAARGWTHMVNPGMLTGSLGYAIGTMIAAAVGKLIHTRCSIFP